jgi:hypothetical protein
LRQSASLLFELLCDIPERPISHDDNIGNLRQLIFATSAKQHVMASVVESDRSVHWNHCDAQRNSDAEPLLRAKTGT